MPCWRLNRKDERKILPLTEAKVVTYNFEVFPMFIMEETVMNDYIVTTYN